MSTSGETADLMVRESIQITESAVKLAGLGAKNLAALLLAALPRSKRIRIDCAPARHYRSFPSSMRI